MGEVLLGVVGRGADRVDVGRVELGREDPLAQEGRGQGAALGGVRQALDRGVVGAVVTPEALVEVDQRELGPEGHDAAPAHANLASYPSGSSTRAATSTSAP